jgi:ribosomal protein S3AE
MKIIHTADWQIGKPFAGIEDDYKRALVRKERIDAVDRIADVAREEGAGLVLVAGTSSIRRARTRPRSRRRRAPSAGSARRWS